MEISGHRHTTAVYPPRKHRRIHWTGGWGGSRTGRDISEANKFIEPLQVLYISNHCAWSGISIDYSNRISWQHSGACCLLSHWRKVMHKIKFTVITSPALPSSQSLPLQPYPVHSQYLSSPTQFAGTNRLSWHTILCRCCMGQSEQWWNFGDTEYWSLLFTHGRGVFLPLQYDTCNEN